VFDGEAVRVVEGRGRFLGDVGLDERISDGLNVYVGDVAVVRREVEDVHLLMNVVVELVER
jgi:hypothetical protein